MDAEHCKTDSIRRLLHVLRLHRWLLLFVAVYFLTAWLTALALQLEFKVSGRLHGMRTSGMALVCWAIGGYSVYVLYVVRPSRPTIHIMRGIQNFLTLERVAGGLLILCTAPFFLAAFSFYKRLIPTIKPFAWDLQFAAWDEALHFGAQPWEHLQPLMSPSMTRLIDLNYMLWFQVILCGLLWYAFYLPNSRFRMQFLLTFLLSWILLGNLAATALSSAGPCYYPYTDNPFASLMNYLAEINRHHQLYAIPTQDILWRMYKNSIPYIGGGVSAMPSMHVAIAYLLWLAAWKQNRVLSAPFAAYAIFIMIGSVHLGWHYALDGYVAILGVWCIWHVAGWIVCRDAWLEDGHVATGTMPIQHHQVAEPRFAPVA